MNKCICNVCGTENEMHYQYCKNCGTKLQKPANSENNTQSQYPPNKFDAATGQPTYNPYANQNNSFVNETYGITEIDGVKTEDIAVYIGPNNKRIINKFSKMELTGSKLFWCWPAAAWGLLGIRGVALWFIYRKMYKLGIILLVVGVLLDCAVSVVSSQGTNSLDNFTGGIFTQEVEEPNHPDLEEIPEIEEGKNSNKKGTLVGNIATAVGDMVLLLSVVFGGMFSMHAYKKHTIKKVKQYNLVNSSERYRQIGLMAVGGTSAALAVLAFFISIVFQTMLEKTIFLFI